MPKSRYTKCLNLYGVLPEDLSRMGSRALHAKFVLRPGVNVVNANAAGLFCENDLNEADEQLESAKRFAALPKPGRAKETVTIQNATKEQVQNALHKIAMRSKKD
jgi:precorrin-4 methylase